MASTLDIRVWGPNAWGIMHSVAEAWEDDGRVAPGDIRSFYESMVRVLPCAECRRHAIAYLGRHPVPLTSKGDLCRWVWQFHNAVNVRTGKRPVRYRDRVRRRRRSPRVAMLVATALALLR